MNLIPQELFNFP